MSTEPMAFITKAKSFFRFLDGKQGSTNIRRSNLETSIFSFYWSLLLLYVALPQGLKTKIGSIDLLNNASPTQIRNAWGPGDAGSLLDTALTWSKFENIDPTNQYWIVHLWTPGMSLIEVPLIWISHIGIPIFWSLLFITTLLWVSIFWLTWKYLTGLIGRLPVASLFLMLGLSWDFQYFFRDSLFYTEGLAFGLLVLGLGVLTWALITKESRLRIFVLAGFFVGTSVLIRHVSDFGLSVFCAIAFIGFVFQRKNAINQILKSVPKKKQNKAKSLIKITDFDFYKLMISGIVANLVLLPWRFLSYFIFGGKPWILSTAAGGVGVGAWTPNSKIGIWGFSGMNWACNIEPLKCISIYLLPQSPHNDLVRLLQAVWAAIQNPISYLNFRGHYLQMNWIPAGVHSIFNFQVISSLLPVALFISGLVILHRSKHALIVAWVWLPFLILELGQLLLIHYESRYFIPIRLFAIGFYLFAIAVKSSKEKVTLDD